MQFEHVVGDERGDPADQAGAGPQAPEQLLGQRSAELSMVPSRAVLLTQIVQERGPAQGQGGMGIMCRRQGMGQEVVRVVRARGETAAGGQFRQDPFHQCTRIESLQGRE